MEATNATLQTPDERTRLRDELLRLIIKSEAERRKSVLSGVNKNNSPERK